MKAIYVDTEFESGYKFKPGITKWVYIIQCAFFVGVSFVT